MNPVGGGPVQRGMPSSGPRRPRSVATVAHVTWCAVVSCLLGATPSLSTQSTTADALTLLARARAARLQQDSLLASYTAQVTQRLSLSIGLLRLAPERLAFRHETAAQVSWQRGAPVEVHLRGARTFVGAWSGNFGSATDRDLADAVPIPHFPGREQLWTGDGMVTDFVGQARATRDSIDERTLVHPLAAGAEAHYLYALGDTAVITMPGPDGAARRITLRELRVTARAPRWNRIVGAFWFDDASARLVRAAYRLSMPTDVYAASRDHASRRAVPRWLGALIGPLETDITAVAVEFALVGDRFWLPRLQTLEGVARAGGVRAAMRIAQHFRYDAVTGMADTRALVAADSTGGSRVVRSRRFGGAVEVRTVVPSDRALLARAPELPASLFDEGEARFTTPTRADLLRTLDWRLQPAAARGPIAYTVGVPMTRWNRVEGLSTGLRVAMPWGGGRWTTADVRGSFADRQVNGELSLARRTGRDAQQIGVYRRLVAGNDWGAPLGVGASLDALLFGRDDGVYHRAVGVDASGERASGTVRAWRLFAEQQSAADVRTTWSLLGSDRGALPNPAATRATFVGASLRLQGEHTGAPRAWRLRGLGRLEAAAGRTDSGGLAYARALLDATVSHGLVGPLDATVAASVGLTAGDVPPQRLFMLGGVPSVRGLRALAARGDALWLTRSEIGWTLPVVRPSVFTDIGWTGARAAWRHPGRALTGAGVGLSLFDGLAHADLARGVHPRGPWRFTLSLDTRF